MAARLSGAKTRIGSSEPREAPARLFYTRCGRRLKVHTWLSTDLVGLGSVPAKTSNYEPPLFPQDSGDRGMGRPVLCVHRLGATRDRESGRGLGSEVLAGEIRMAKSRRRWPTVAWR